MFHAEFDIIEELEIGNTRFRLVEDPVRKSRKIQLWSSLSKQWNIMTRYNVESEWTEWKYTAAKIKARKAK